MAKIDESAKTTPAPRLSIKPTDKKANFANNMAKQQKVNATKPIVKSQQVTSRRTGKK